MKRLFIISKEKAFHICDKSQYYESTWWEKLHLQLRCLWCSTTRQYVNRNNKLTKALKTSKLQCLELSERQQLKEQLHQQLKQEM